MDDAEEPGGPTAPTAPTQGVRTESLDRLEALNWLATIQVGATTATGGLLVAFGATANRVWEILDNDEVRWALIGAGAAAIGSVIAGLSSHTAASDRVRIACLWLGTALYAVSLSLVIVAASAGADFPGYPTIQEFSVTSTGERQKRLHFVVHADSLDETQRLAVRLIDPKRNMIYESSLPPAPSGTVNQAVDALVRVPGRWSLQVWRFDEGASKGQGADCPQLTQPATLAEKTARWSVCSFLVLPA